MAPALQHLRMYFERRETHMEQLDNKPTCNKVLNRVVQTSAKGISSMRIHTTAAVPWLCCVILEDYSDWSQRMIKNWAPWLDVLLVNVFVLLKSCGQKKKKKIWITACFWLGFYRLWDIYREIRCTYTWSSLVTVLKNDSWSFWGKWKRFWKWEVRNYTHFENLWSRVWGKTPACLSMKYIFIG